MRDAWRWPMLAFALMGITMSTWKPRGIRNNNPGNIRRTGTAWRGMSPQQPDPEYITFQSPVWGIRAMARILKNYRALYGLDTVAGIVSRWAPPSENNTAAYIASVSAAVGVDPDQPLTADQLPALVAAMIYHENGQQPYSLNTIKEGVALA